MNPLKLKVCGMREPGNIAALLAEKPDYVGLIFFKKSPRDAERTEPEELPAFPEGIKKTGVFVNAPVEQMLYTASRYGLQALQLHGQESPETAARVKEAGYEVIKVFSVAESFDFEQLRPFLHVADYFLFDTKGKNAGGNGVAFDWEVLKAYPFDKPFFLSGGLDLENIAGISSLSHLPLYALDVNSRFETEPGIKDIASVRQLVHRLQEL